MEENAVVDESCDGSNGGSDGGGDDDDDEGRMRWS